MRPYLKQKNKILILVLLEKVANGRERQTYTGS